MGDGHGETPSPRSRSDEGSSRSPWSATSPRSAMSLVLALGMLVVVLAVGLAVLVVRDDGNQEVSDGGRSLARDAAATTSNRDQTTTSAGDTTTTSASPREQMIVAVLAAGFGEQYGEVVSDAEAECMARVVVDVVGIERMAAPLDPGSVSETEAQQIDAGLRDCVGPEIAARLNLD